MAKTLSITIITAGDIERRHQRYLNCETDKQYAQLANELRTFCPRYFKPASFLFASARLISLVELFWACTNEKTNAKRIKRVELSKRTAVVAFQYISPQKKFWPKFRKFWPKF